jgi:hypothetical protein|tara:strand:- start:372 stop:608 length:237 start_codon:yes stop_codon:yes gene_type:complete
MTINKAIFYIKYYADKHGKTIERKATLDDECYEGKHKIHGHPYKIYVDVDATEEKNNGKNQYRCASHSWEINQTRTIS